MATLIELRQAEFDARQTVIELRRAVFEARQVDQTERLAEAERTLQTISDQRAAAERDQNVDHGSILAVPRAANLLGKDTTGLEVKVDLRMSSIATSLVHLFDGTSDPLVSFEVRNTNEKTKRVRLVSYVEGFSAHAIETVELAHNDNVVRTQMPTFFPGPLSRLTELTRATLNIEVQDLDASTEVHRTIPVWLLARTTAPLMVKDPSTATWKDMTPYLAAFVTPNAPSVMAYLRTALDKHPHKRLVGYQLSPEKAAAKAKTDPEEVLSQVRAIYEALSASGVSYINSIIDFTPEIGTANNQRVRLPRESLKDKSANCIDGTLLMASLLEAASLNPAIVIIPGHAFLGWETWKTNDEWRYIETTMLSTDGFDAACAQGDLTAKQWGAVPDAKGQPMLKRWSLRELRARGITPVE